MGSPGGCTAALRRRRSAHPRWPVDRIAKPNSKPSCGVRYNYGVSVPACPYCLAKLGYKRQRDHDCKSCGRRIIVRNDSSGTWLLTEEQAVAWDGMDAAELART